MPEPIDTSKLGPISVMSSLEGPDQIDSMTEDELRQALHIAIPVLVMVTKYPYTVGASDAEEALGKIGKLAHGS